VKPVKRKGIAMEVLEITAAGPDTLAGRLSQGGVQVPEALRYAAALAQALRQIHDGGAIHGSVSTDSVVFAEGELRLAPADPTAENRRAEVTADVRGFGEVFHEMLTGRKVSEGCESTGIAGADRMIAASLSEQQPNMQKVSLELKLLALEVRRADRQPSWRRDAAAAEIRDEMQRMEERIAARIDAHEQLVAAHQRSVNEAMNAARTAAGTLDVKLELIRHKQKECEDRIAAIETAVDFLSRRNEAGEQRLAEEVRTIQNAVEDEAALLASVRAHMAQTDDLVARVVEALEGIQDNVFELADEAA
jgi:hypothetical protein